jgi:F0F1-type ATP synthase membrane subunit c/vacuolar-type H+-ATPase subunit K
MWRRIRDVLLSPLRAALSLMQWGTASQRLLSITLPARVAVLVAIFLVICVIAAYAVFYNTPNRTSWDYWVSPLRLTIIALLAIAIPLVVYQTLKLWLQGDVSRFPDIDYAWKAGLAQLAQHGLNLAETPLFVLFGSAGILQEKALFEASRLGLRLQQVPPGDAALHWYANPDGIYLVLTNVGCLSGLASLARVADEEAQAAPEPAAGRAADPVRVTIVGHSPGRPGPSLAVAAAAAAAPIAARPALAPDIRGTMMVGAASMGAEQVSAPAAKRTLALTPGAAGEHERRMEYLCQLVRRHRRPLCPINGLLTLLPYGLIERGPLEATEVQRALRRDVGALRRTLQIRCPVTALVVGMEAESGFRELVRRVGRERVSAQRFGKGFSLANPPTVERVESVCAHACGAFEDWVYNLFREKGALSRPGNTKLYGLLCKIRRNVQGRLAGILVSGLARDPEQDPQAEPLLFGGCYFAATGETEDRQAFVKGVFDKLPEQQEELQWTDRALGEDARYRQSAQLVLAMDLVLLLTLTGMAVYRWFFRL